MKIIDQIAAGGSPCCSSPSDTPDIITLADRILVMHDFHIVGEVENDHHYETTSKAIMRCIHVVCEVRQSPGAVA